MPLLKYLPHEICKPMQPNFLPHKICKSEPKPTPAICIYPAAPHEFFIPKPTKKPPTPPKPVTPIRARLWGLLPDQKKKKKINQNQVRSKKQAEVSRFHFHFSTRKAQLPISSVTHCSVRPRLLSQPNQGVDYPNLMNWHVLSNLISICLLCASILSQSHATAFVLCFA